MAIWEKALDEIEDMLVKAMKNKVVDDEDSEIALSGADVEQKIFDDAE